MNEKDKARIISEKTNFTVLMICNTQVLGVYPLEVQFEMMKEIRFD